MSTMTESPYFPTQQHGVQASTSLIHPLTYDLSSHRRSPSSTLSPPPSGLHYSHQTNLNSNQNQMDYRDTATAASPDPGSPYRPSPHPHSGQNSFGPHQPPSNQPSPSQHLTPPEGPGPSNWAQQQATQLSQQLVALGHQRVIETSASGTRLVHNEGLGTTGLIDDHAMDLSDHNDGNNTHSWVQQQQQQLQESSQVGCIDGRGDGGVVMQNGRTTEGSPSNGDRRRRYEDGRLGVLPPEAPRSYSAIKLVGDGSFGTVWLCDWHSPLDPSTTLSAMQCGAGARADWVGKRLVAVKRMKRVWEGGWKEASALGELVSLRDIAPHPAIIPLYDAFLQPETKELYFVFECMEGNLYQLTKSRKGRPLAGGLIASVFHQIVGGLHHIHKSGYFHRDMKPENLLVTTTGLQDYLPVIDPERESIEAAIIASGRKPLTRPAPRIEKDVTVIVKLADFGLARSLESKPPYTEYVSTRWYRAPEVLLRSKEYSAPVDMWALGTILAEIINLKALFPGQSEVDQVWRICEVLGDPSSEYGHDSRGRPRGGGEWIRGIKMAKAVGFAFPKKIPMQFASLFPPTVPISLIDCISSLLRYNPRYRLTSEECLDHPYFHLTAPHLKIASRLPQVPFSQGQPALADLQKMLSQMEQQRMQQQQDFVSYSSEPPRALPPSHSASPVHSKPAFKMEDRRVLPPPSGSRSFYSQNARNSSFPHMSSELLPPSQDHSTGTPASSNTTFVQSSMAKNTGATALMEQLRELDLPTADLASYGHRPSLNPQINPPYARPDQSRHSLQSHWSTKSPYQTLQQASTPEVHQTAGEVGYKRHFESQPALLSQPTSPFRAEFDPVSPIPAIPTHINQQQRSHLPPHMLTPTALASPDQARWHESQAQVTSDDVNMEPSLAPVVQPSRLLATQTPTQAQTQTQTQSKTQTQTQTQAQTQAPAQTHTRSSLPVSGKKKKWGLSSVFGHSESKADLGPSRHASVHAGDSRSHSNSLKRSQSNLKINEAPASSSIDPSTITDPKKAKKEAERQAKELEKAKREAAERAQKERARAVMQKRNLLEQQRRQQGAKMELEWSSDTATLSRQMMQNASKMSVATKHQSQKAHHGSQPPMSSTSSAHPSPPHPYGGVNPGQSKVGQSFDHSRERVDSNQLENGSISGSGSNMSPDAFRSKARKRDDDGDHSQSMSRLDLTTMRNTSVLTVGTIDSDPGPARPARQFPSGGGVGEGPSMTAPERLGTNSVSSLNLNLNLGQKLANQAQAGGFQSNTSLDRHLAHEFRARANLAQSIGGGGSSSSLNLNLSQSPSQCQSQSQSPFASHSHGKSASASGPTTPYGQPMGHAVASGYGFGRTGGQKLPSIADWEQLNSDVPLEGGNVNPMFRVVSGMCLTLPCPWG